jgi:hemolysin activation/secretion protein
MLCIGFINFAFCATPGGVIRQQVQIQRTEDDLRREAERRHKDMQARPPREIRIERPEIPETSPDDGICVPVDTIRFAGETLLSGSDKDRLAAPFTGRCLGMSEINEVVRAVTNLYIERGYVTTRAAVPVQDLASRTLEIRVIEGAVEDIRLNEDSPADRLRVAMAFPGVKAGRPLNLRDIEQGMDQMNRLPSSDVQIKIEPGGRPGSSLVVIEDRPGRTWRVGAGLDNSGQVSTGATKYKASLTKDNPLALNDMLTLSANGDARALEDFSRPASQGYSGQYTVSYGPWTVTASASFSEYRAQLEGGGAQYMSSGDTTIWGLDVNRLLHRSPDSRTSVDLNFSVKDVDNYIENERLVTGSYDLSILGATLDHSRRLFGGVLSLRGGIDVGLPVLEAETDKSSEKSVPKSEFRKLHATGSLQRPVDVGGRPVTFSTRASGQWSPDTLYSSERLDLGGRHTVRGFQRDSLTGDSGAYIRNEISAPILPKEAMPGGLGAVLGELSLYAGYDAGFIHRDKDDDYERGVLQGAALGLRTQGGYLDSDLCLSKPLDAPSFMNNRDWEIYWELTSNF